MEGSAAVNGIQGSLLGMGHRDAQRHDAVSKCLENTHLYNRGYSPSSWSSTNTDLEQLLSPKIPAYPNPPFPRSSSCIQATAFFSCKDHGKKCINKNTSCGCCRFKSGCNFQYMLPVIQATRWPADNKGFLCQQDLSDGSKPGWFSHPRS